MGKSSSPSPPPLWTKANKMKFIKYSLLHTGGGGEQMGERRALNVVSVIIHDLYYKHRIRYLFVKINNDLFFLESFVLEKYGLVRMMRWSGGDSSYIMSPLAFPDSGCGTKRWNFYGREFGTFKL